MRGTIITVITLLVMVVALFYIARYPGEVGVLLASGTFPRILAWFCLIYGSWGLARARLSVPVAMVFFAAAGFFAYVGPYVPFIRNYY